MKNEIGILSQMVIEGIEALEQLEKFDDISKFKTWKDNYPEINEKVKGIMELRN